MGPRGAHGSWCPPSTPRKMSAGLYWVPRDLQAPWQRAPGEARVAPAPQKGRQHPAVGAGCCSCHGNGIQGGGMLQLPWEWDGGCEEDGDAVVATGMEWGDLLRCGCHGSRMLPILGRGPCGCPAHHGAAHPPALQQPHLPAPWSPSCKSPHSHSPSPIPGPWGGRAALSHQCPRD